MESALNAPSENKLLPFEGNTLYQFAGRSREILQFGKTLRGYTKNDTGGVVAGERAFYSLDEFRMLKYRSRIPRF